MAAVVREEAATAKEQEDAQVTPANKAMPLKETLLPVIMLLLLIAVLQIVTITALLPMIIPMVRRAAVVIGVAMGAHAVLARRITNKQRANNCPLLVFI